MSEKKEEEAPVVTPLRRGSSTLSRSGSSSGLMSSPSMSRTNSSRGLRFDDRPGGSFGTGPHPTFMGELEATCPVASYERDGTEALSSPLTRKDSFSFKQERRSSVVDELVKPVASNPGPGSYNTAPQTFRTNSFNKKTIESVRQASEVNSPQRKPPRRGSSSGEVFSRLYSTPTQSSASTEDKPREFSEATESDFDKLLKRSNSGRWVGGGRRDSAAEDSRLQILNKAFGEQ